MPDDTTYIGVAEDTRTEAEKLRDWTAEEAYGELPPVTWREKKAPAKGAVNYRLGKKVWRRFDRRDQRGGSCVAHSHAMALGIENHTEEGKFLIESARPIFSRRQNRPASGMSSVDAFKIVKAHGTTSEARLPSLNLRDEEMDAPFPWGPEDAAHAEKYKADSYVTLFAQRPGETFSIDAVFRAIETFKCGVIIHIFAKGDEWKKSAPSIIWQNLTYGEATIKHACLPVDGTLYKGKKRALVTHESYANDSSDYGQRILTEDFLAKRCRYAAHYLPRPNGATPQAPKPSLYRDLKWGDSGEDVRQLQAYLQSTGHMTTVWKDGSPLPPTGLWKSITAQAVRKWQAASGINTFASSPDDAVKFGPKSRAKLQE